LRSVHRRLLVTDQDVAQPRLRVQGIVERQHRAARIAENRVDAEVQEGLDQRRRSTGERCSKRDRGLARSRGVHGDGDSIVHAVIVPAKARKMVPFCRHAL
jgi:hypothetical protein